MLAIVLSGVIALLALVASLAMLRWFLRGGVASVLGAGHGERPRLHEPPGVPHELRAPFSELAFLRPGALALGVCMLTVLATLAARRGVTRRRRRYVRLRVEPYRTDHAGAESLERMYDALHKRLLVRPWRRIVGGQAGVSLEVHYGSRPEPHEASETSADGIPDARQAWLAVSCPGGEEAIVESALRGAYPNLRLRACGPIDVPPNLVRLRKRSAFIRRAKALDRFEQDREPPMNRLITAMAAAGEPALVQLALTPAPASVEALARQLYRRREAEVSRRRRERGVTRDRSMLSDHELRGSLAIQHRALFFLDLRVAAHSRRACKQIAAELRLQSGENRLVERAVATGALLRGSRARRVLRGEGTSLAPLARGVFAASEIASLWQLPSVAFAAVPFARSGIANAPAPPAIFRPQRGPGLLRDALGPVSIHAALRRQNVAVPGTVEQGKSSVLVASVAEDLARDRCAVIVLDPKGDAADAAVSLVARTRTCTLLDLADPTCGFNPLAVRAPADVIADYVVAALKHLFDDGDIRASSDRYLRNAIIAVLAYEPVATLWDAARLLSVGEEGYAYRRAVGARVMTLPEFKEIAQFFTAELTAQLADARSSTTAKLDAPVNKLARLLNSTSIKRVLLNESLRVDLDRVIANREVLVVKGALGGMGAGNTAVVMQLLVGMLDAALARQQDRVTEADRVAVALKIDEAPLVLNRGFAQTMALKRSAGLETLACWQTDSQWTDRDVRDQLDALFAHRIYFATSSARDARAAAALTMSEFSDAIRPGIAHIATLAHPDARMHLPRHHAIASFTTPEGRQPPFIAETIPLRVDADRLSLHAELQQGRGGRRLSDLRQPHWERRRLPSPPERTPPAGARAPSPSPPHAPAEGFSELMQLDRAQSVRRIANRGPLTGVRTDRVDIEVLELLAALGHVLSSQVHRRFGGGRSVSSTQRRLKRLADSGLIERIQFHRRDGGGVPMCCLLADRGRALVERRGRPGAAASGRPSPGPALGQPSLQPALSQRESLRRARREVHVAGWALAFQAQLGAAHTSFRDPGDARLSPPEKGSRRVGPSELSLPGGRVPHDFLTTAADGRRCQIERFESVHADCIVQTPSGDVIVVFDGGSPAQDFLRSLERWEHFLAGWSLHTRRYGPPRGVPATVVFVCRDPPRARMLAALADRHLVACHAYPGEHPWEWGYPGRERVVFAPERAMHERDMTVLAVASLPPQVRVDAHGGDMRVAEPQIVTRELLASGEAVAQAGGEPPSASDQCSGSAAT